MIIYCFLVCLIDLISLNEFDVETSLKLRKRTQHYKYGINCPIILPAPQAHIFYHEPRRHISCES